MNKFNRNIFLLYIYSTLLKRPILPIITVYYLFNQLSFTEIGIIGSATAVSSLIMEIPGGIYADTYGRRSSLTIGSAFGVLTMLFLLFGNSFAPFLIAGICYGLSYAFESGTRSSILYDSLLELRKEKEYKKYKGKQVSIAHLINAVILLLIPVLYSINYKIPFIIGAVFFLTNLVITFFIVEPGNSIKRNKNVPLMFSKFTDSLAGFSVNKYLFFLATTSTILGAFIYSNEHFIQPVFKFAQIDVLYFGVIYTLMRLTTSMSTAIVHNIESIITSRKVLGFSVLLIFLSLLSFSSKLFIVVIVGVIIQKIADGFQKIIIEHEINKEATSQNRTTLLSIVSLVQNLAKAALVFAMGVLADAISLSSMYFVVSILFVIIISGFFIYSRNHWHKIGLTNH